METGLGVRRIASRTASLLFPLLCVGLLEANAGIATWAPAPPSLEALDPTFMKAVTASVSQHDVKKILTFQRSAAPVHLRLFTACDALQHCTISTMMDFPGAEHQAPALSLQVAVHVAPGTASARRTTGASWHVQLTDPATNLPSDYGGDFSELNGMAPTDEHEAIASLLVSIQSAIEHVLGANGIVAKPGTLDV